MKNIAVFVTILLVLTSCKKEDLPPVDYGTCNEDALPIVMAHGFLASGDTYANQIMRFSSNRYCEDNLFLFDWNSLSQDADNVGLLDAFIDDVLEKTGKSQVNLAGHSAGGGLGYNYLSDPERAAKVAHYAHIGSSAQDGPAGAEQEIPTINIWSSEDLVVESGDIDGATNVKVPQKDHYEIVTCEEAFEAMYSFFNDGAAPKTVEITEQSTIEIGGRVVTLGENTPQPGAEIKVYQVQTESGLRASETPVSTIITDNNGNWGPLVVKKGANYEFEVNTTTAGSRTVYYYREGFVRSNPVVYLRTLPPPGSFVSALFNDIPSSESQSALTIFAANQGVSAGRDDLYVNDFELSNMTFCDPENNTIALFMYDGNDNETTDLSSQGLFGNFPFLSSADMFLPAGEDATIEVELNGRTLNVANKKSSEGIIIAVFD